MVLAHLAARIRDELMAIVERHAETLVRQDFADDTIHFEMLFLCHSTAPEKRTKKASRRSRFATISRCEADLRPACDLE